MYTYKLGGMLITDELYHDDLEAMTFGRKDQNELRHSGIKGMSWGKRRFQNEDGSLTAAGRNRYGVGDPMKGVSAYSDTGGHGGSGVSYTRLPSGSGGANRATTGSTTSVRRLSSVTSSVRPGVSQQMRNQTANKVANIQQRVANSTNNGKKAADNLFGRIGNWASNAAKDVGNFATNTYNDASKAVTNAANTVGNTVKNVAQDVSDWYTGDKAGKEAQRYDNAVQNFERNGDQNINAGQGIISRGLKYPESAYDLESGKSMRDKTVIEGLDRRNLGYDQHDIARQYGQKADEAQAKYEAAPRQVINSAAENIGNAAKDAGNWIGNAFNDAKNWVGDRAQDVGNAATNAYNDASKAVGNVAQGVKDWYTGDKAAREAQRYDNVVQNFERNGERNINEGINTISRGINAPDSAYDIETGEKWGNKLIDDGVKQRELGYDQHDIAREYGRKADEAKAQYDAAPRQLFEGAGNWIGDRVNDVGNALKPGVDAVRDAGNWVGDTAKNIYDDVDYRLYSLGQDIAQPAQNRAWQDFQNRIAQDRETYNREFPSGDYQTWKGASNRIDDAFKDYQRESNKIEKNPIGSAINNVGRSIDEGAKKAGNWAGNAAQDVGNWAGNAANDVANWGGQQVENGKKLLKKIFG